MGNWEMVFWVFLLGYHSFAFFVFQGRYPPNQRTGWKYEPYDTGRELENEVFEKIDELKEILDDGCDDDRGRYVSSCACGVCIPA